GMQRHPAKHELLAYAECAVNGQPLSAQIGGHIARCRPCWDEVDAMRRTLRVASVGAGLEPSRDLTAQILLAAKKARSEESRRQRRDRSVTAVVKTVGYAAALVLVSALWFGAASEARASAAEAAPAPSVELAAVVPSAEELRQAAAEIQTYAEAV